jgi:hypothetical protein
MTGAEVVVAAAGKAMISPLIQATSKYVADKLKTIKANQQENAKAPVEYLDCAVAIMTTLEAESDEILLAGSKLGRVPDIDQATAAANALLDRLGGLLTGEYLRPQLMELSGRLDSSRQTLKDDAQRFFGTVSPPKDKQEILDELDNACGYIKSYLGYLGPFKGPSAVLLHELSALKQDIEQNAMGDAVSRIWGYQVIGQKAWNTLMQREPLFFVRANRMGNLSESIRAKLGKK